MLSACLVGTSKRRLRCTLHDAGWIGPSPSTHQQDGSKWPQRTQCICDKRLGEEARMVHCSACWYQNLLRGQPCYGCELLYPSVHPLKQAPVPDHPHYVDKRPDVDPQVPRTIHVPGNAGVLAVCYRLPLLLGAHAVDHGHGTKDTYTLQQSGKDELQRQFLRGEREPTLFTIHVNETLQHRLKVFGEVFVLATVEPPPELVANGVARHPSPVQHPSVQLVLGVAPEEGIVHVQVDVCPSDISNVPITPPPCLCRVRVHFAQDRLILKNELIGRALGREERLGNSLHKV
mmetsp:Transcript_54031/g.125647  ORF Transcript_54031/g.125647 Transcript_54031/m.125647 type:complete len:289 (-) Transcript_54031:1243-2109(-)